MRLKNHWPRDQRPFLHPESLQIFRFTASSLQFTSLIFYRVQVREHLTRDQRPFLHPDHSRPLDSQLLLFSSPHSSSTGFRSENTWHEIKTIPSSRITPDLQIHSFSSSVHLTHSTGFRSENTWHEIRDRSFIQNHSRPFRFTASPLQFTSLIFYRVQIREHLTRDQRPFLHPESLQIFRFTASPLQFTSLMFYRVQIREHLTRDQRPFLHPESLQIFRFTASSLQFTRLSTGFRSENTWHEIRDRSFIQNHSRPFRFTASPLPVHLTHLLQGSDQRTPDTRSETIPSSRITPDLQIHSFFSSVHSLIFYRVQVREHLTRDQRPFLHPESLQIFRFTASPLQFTHSSSTGFRSENTWHEIRDHSFIQNHSRSSDSQLLLFSSLTHLLQGSGQRTPDTRSETIPSSRITPDLQIHSFSSSVHSLISTGFRSENTWHEIRDHSFIQNHSRSSDSQLLLFSSLTHLLQGSDQRTGMDMEEAWFCAYFCVVCEVCVGIIVRLEDPIMAHYNISNRISHLLIFLSVGIW